MSAIVCSHPHIPVVHETRVEFKGVENASCLPQDVRYVYPKLCGAAWECQAIFVPCSEPRRNCSVLVTPDARCTPERELQAALTHRRQPSAPNGLLIQERNSHSPLVTSLVTPPRLLTFEKRRLVFES